MSERQSDISTVKGREHLAIRKEPYWRKLDKGEYIGFRRGPDTWIARWTNEDSHYKYESLGTAVDLEWGAAKKKAELWFAQCRGGVIRSGTVEECCQQYVAAQRNTKGDNAADRSQAMLSRFIYDTPFGKRNLNVLTTAHIEQWRDSLVTAQRSKRTVNRILRSFKAALNFGFQRSLCPSDAAWRRVKAMRGEGATDRSRTAYLTQRQRGLLLAKCDADLGNFLRGLLYTAARPGELMSATVGDLDCTHGRLTLSSLKGLGVERSREVPLSPQAVEFFRQMAKGKLPTAPLIMFRGAEWDRQKISVSLRAIVIAVNAETREPADRLPLDTVAYTMRHCAISDMLKAGLDVGTVAKIAGTSITMISTHYFKFIHTDVSAKLATIQAF